MTKDQRQRDELLREAAILLGRCLTQRVPKVTRIAIVAWMDKIAKEGIDVPDPRMS